ncbi:MAG TPA: hypothetical protein PLB10_12395 [Thiolinea sp.]|nr:hypothetical protein [Thiolinea sp.]
MKRAGQQALRVSLLLAAAGLTGACTVPDTTSGDGVTDTGNTGNNGNVTETGTDAVAGTPDTPATPEAVPAGQAMINAGVVCLHAISGTETKAYYLPLGTGCASSSQHRWADTRFSVQVMPQGESDAVRVDSFTRHVPNDSPIATSDCAGANVQQQTVLLTAAGGNVDVYWGGRRIGQYRNTPNAMFCREMQAGVPKPAGAAAYEAVNSLSGR